MYFCLKKEIKMNFEILFDKIRNGEITREEAKKFISLEISETAKKSILDINREIRTGIPEIIYAEHKTLEQVLDIVESIMKKEELLIISRFKNNNDIISALKDKFKIHNSEKVLIIGELPKPVAKVLVISAGSADNPITDEVYYTLKAIAIEPVIFRDRGIAHPTRVIEAIQEGIKNNVKVAVVIAGMEGALASFVSSLVNMPVIGVPTSVGYGYKAGESALIAMLSACTPNLAVVNIDGGIRAAVIASLIAKNSYNNENV
jgi:NCAIR mutase (PurE)-related protein